MDFPANKKLRGLSLFSGYGGNELALYPYIRTVAYCEIEPYMQAVLLSRMLDGHIDAAPIWDDITTLRGENIGESIDVIFGGFPCQDISAAGRGEGLGGQRSGLFFEICRLADELKPPFIFLENVPAIRTRGGETVVKELAKRGYDCRWTVVSAADVGAPHKRERWFLLAADTPSLRRREGTCEDLCGGRLAKLDAESSDDSREGRSNSLEVAETRSWNQVESPLCRVADGYTAELDEIRRAGDGLVGEARPKEPRLRQLGSRVWKERIRACGNGVVPTQCRRAFEILLFGESK